MADEARKTLLEEIEERNCPGCNIDRFKQEQRGIPYIHLSFIWLVSLCTGSIFSSFSFLYVCFVSTNLCVSLIRMMLKTLWCMSALPISSLFPYLYFMIRDFHVAEKEEDIGFYAGFVASSFMIGRALTSILWGKLADRYGRKPIILMATFSVLALTIPQYLNKDNFLFLQNFYFPDTLFRIIFNTLFGLSTSFWFAISVRFLLGCVNCLLGVIRAYASEVVSEEYHALSLSVVSTSRGIGLIIGPAIGGYLAQPAKKYPNLFSQDSVFGSFPYFLPSLVISAYATGAFIACWWLPVMLIPLLSCYPSIASLSGLTLHLVINCASILKNALSISLVTGLFILLNKAVPQSQRGAANGISMTAMSIFKSFGPAGGGILFSWAQKRQTATFLPGDDEMVFFVLNLVQLIGLILTFIPYISQNQ